MCGALLGKCHKALPGAATWRI